MFTNDTYMSTVSYACHNGFTEVGGDTVRHCMEDKEWNGTSLQCKGGSSVV